MQLPIALVSRDASLRAKRACHVPGLDAIKQLTHSTAAERGKEVNLAARFHASQQATRRDDAINGNGQPRRNAVVCHHARGQTRALLFDICHYLPQRAPRNREFGPSTREVAHLRRYMHGGHYYVAWLADYFFNAAHTLGGLIGSSRIRTPIA